MPDNDDPGDIGLPGSVGDEIYRGDKEKCDHCGKEFSWGQLIMVSEDPKLIFCCRDQNTLEDLLQSCVALWVYKNKIGLRCTVFKFQGD